MALLGTHDRPTIKRKAFLLCHSGVLNALLYKKYRPKPYTLYRINLEFESLDKDHSFYVTQPIYYRTVFNWFH